MRIDKLALELREDGTVLFQGKRCTRIRHKTRGYQTVVLPLHRLIAQAFHGSPPTPKHVCHHRDGNPRNNAASNLQWLTQAENTREHFKGQARKLTDAQINDILLMKPAPKVTLKELARSIGISIGAIGLIRSGRNFKNGWYYGHGRSTLTRAQYDQIKAWQKPVITTSSVAQRFHVSRQYILSIWSGHIKPR